MSRRSDQIPLHAFEPVLGDLARWRRGRVAGSRIPKNLWRAAVRLARQHGVSKTALALHLDYHGLKNRLEASAPVDRTQPMGPRRRASPAFIELPFGVPLQPAECVLQLEDDKRGRLRIELRGRPSSDIEPLALALWSRLK
jgi:hypothetical protein